jgi:hypothetical protein
MSETLKQKKPMSWWRRIVLWLVLAVMALLAVVILASYIVGSQLGAEIVKISEAGEPLTFADLAKADFSRIDTDNDAARYYIAALLALSPASSDNLKRVNSFYRQNMISLPANQVPSELRESVAQNLANVQPVLEKLDQAANLPLAYFDIGINRGIEECKARLRRAETTSILLSLRTLDLILGAEDDAAANSAISMLKMMRILDSHPTFALHSVKIAFVAVACQDIRLMLERSHPSTETLAKLQQTLSETIPADALERAFLAERVYQVEIGRNFMPRHITETYLQDEVPNIPERLRFPKWIFVEGRLGLRRKSRAFFRKMAELISACRQPWPKPLDIGSGDASKSAGKSNELMSRAAKVIQITASGLTAVRCTSLAVAIERYRRANNELPGSLDDLAPNYINVIPLDPFTGKNLLYNHDEESYVVYSTNINRQDDGGAIKPESGETVSSDLGLQIRFAGLK